MDWSVLRKHFMAERKRLKVKQTAIAKKGGIDQSAISKIETDPDYTPQADTFVSAIEGLGVPVWSFFAALEGMSRAELQNQHLKSVASSLHTPPVRTEAADALVVPAGVVLSNEQYDEYCRLRAREATARASIEQATKADRQESRRRPPRAHRS